MDTKSIEWRFEGNWNKVKGSLKEKYGKLTDDDFLIEEGQTEQWVGKMQNKLGKTRQEILEELDAIVS